MGIGECIVFQSYRLYSTRYHLVLKNQLWGLFYGGVVIPMSNNPDTATDTQINWIYDMSVPRFV